MYMDGKNNLLNSVKVVLVGTTHPGNIGATARAIKNMGILDLALVEPKEFPSDEATFRSKAAKDILENATVYESLKDAVSGCELVVGTSARDRTVPWPVLSPSEAAKEMHKCSLNGDVAIVFGREDRGLTNEECARGLSSFSSNEVEKIIGHHSKEIEKILGYISKSEVVHKDDMVEI